MLKDYCGAEYKTVGDLPEVIEDHKYTNWLKSLTIEELKALIYWKSEYEI